MGKKKGKKAAKGPVVSGPSVEVLEQNYKTSCKNIGASQEAVVLKNFSGGGEEDGKGGVFSQLNIGECNLKALGVRALVSAILGKGDGMSGETYENLLAIRLWSCNIGDDGAVAIGDLFRNGGSSIRIAMLELQDNNIGPQGAKSLGSSLGKSGYGLLTRLVLDNNITLGANGGQGCIELCKGLSTNCSIKKLSLGHCKLPPQSGHGLARVLGNKGSALEDLHLPHNDLGPDGLLAISQVLKKNSTLKRLNLFDNKLGEKFDSEHKCTGEEDDDGSQSTFNVLAEALAVNTSLEFLDIDQNHMNLPDVEALKESLSQNKTLSVFLVDHNLPAEVFAALGRDGSSGKKKGGKGKKKKGKKKKK